jgi:hypothetical protein
MLSLISYIGFTFQLTHRRGGEGVGAGASRSMLQSMEGPPMRSAASAGRAGKLSLMEGVVGEVGDGKLSLKAGAPRSVLQSMKGGRR